MTDKKMKKNAVIGKLLKVLKYFSLIFFSFVSVLPVVSCVITALKSEEEYNTTNVMTLPKKWFNFQNFSDAFRQAGMGRAFLNSLLILVCVLIISTLIGTQLAYVLSRFKFPGNGLIRGLFLFATLLPGIAMQIAVYQLMFKLGLINSILGYVVMMCGTDIISIYIYIQYFENISVSLDESAIVDGASYFTILTKIYLPLSKPVLATLALFYAVGRWNGYSDALMYMKNKDFYPLQLLLYNILNNINSVEVATQEGFSTPGLSESLKAAIVMFSTIPILCIYPFLQKYFIHGVTLGAVKE